MNRVGIVLGNDSFSTNDSIESIKKVEKQRLLENHRSDMVERFLDREEKEMEADEELDKLMLSTFCSDITDDVMDFDSAYPMDCITVSKKEPASLSSKKKGKKKKK